MNFLILIIFSLIQLLSMLIHYSSSTHMECLYRNDTWTIANKVYVCDTQNFLNIISPESAVITSSTNAHMEGKGNTDVTAYVAYGKRIEYFPRKLEKIFGNLKGIYIQKCSLRKIQNSDLKVFPYLFELSVGFNQIDVLEDDVFSSNPNLQNIVLSGNTIYHIGLKVFDNLNKLSYLQFAECDCINAVAIDSASQVKKLIKKLKLECYKTDYELINTEISKIEDDSQICKNSDVERKIQSIQEMDLSDSDLVQVRLERLIEKKDHWCTKEKFEAVSIMLQKLSKAFNNLNKQNGGQDMLNLDVGNQEVNQKLEKLQKAVDQMNIRLILIGASALFVTVIIVIVYSKAIF